MRPDIAECALQHRKALGLTVEGQAQQLELARSTIHSWTQRPPAWWQVAGQLSPLAVLAQMADRLIVRSGPTIKLSAELHGGRGLAWQVDAEAAGGAVSAYGLTADHAALTILQRLAELAEDA